MVNVLTDIFCRIRKNRPSCFVWNKKGMPILKVLNHMIVNNNAITNALNVVGKNVASTRRLRMLLRYSSGIYSRGKFERALAENTERKILLIHPHGNEQVKPLFQEGVRNQIKSLGKYFAKKDFRKVNTEIINTL
jgi:hypothetical protein